jgi:hypothetical protein
MKDIAIKDLMLELLTGHYITTKSSFNFSLISHIFKSFFLTKKSTLDFSQCHKEFMHSYLLASHGPQAVTSNILFLINSYSVYSFFDIDYNLRQSFLSRCLNIGISTVKKGYRKTSAVQTSTGLIMLENIA